MDNNQIPTVQPVAVDDHRAQAKLIVKKEHKSSLTKTIVIVILSLVSITFIGLFVWMTLKYTEVNDDVEGQIAAKVDEAKAEQAEKDEADFAEREKQPYKTFSGPADYGQLTFDYPKTWSVYIAADAANGGDYSAYFNPIEVNPISNSDSLYALRLIIRNSSFENVISGYQDDELKMETIIVNGEYTANRYSGTIPGTEFDGYIVVIKIRDKTAILQTDSVLFEDDFNKLIETITFNA